jgi:hypothetical protein
MTVEQEKVGGHNDAIYGPVPKKDQLFNVEFLEIAPTPILAYAPFKFDLLFNVQCFFCLGPI